MVDVFKVRACVQGAEKAPSSEAFAALFERQICGVVASDVDARGGVAVLCFASEAARRVQLQIPHALVVGDAVLHVTLRAIPGSQPTAAATWEPIDDVAAVEGAVRAHFSTVAKPTAVTLNADDLSPKFGGDDKTQQRGVLPQQQQQQQQRRDGDEDDDDDDDTETEPQVLDDEERDDHLCRRPSCDDTSSESSYDKEAHVEAQPDCVNEPQKTQPQRRYNYVLTFTRSEVRDAVARLGALEWEGLALTMRRDGKSNASGKRKNKPGARTGVGGDDARLQVWIGGIANLASRERVVDFFDNDMCRVQSISARGHEARVVFATAEGRRCVAHNPRHYVVVHEDDEAIVLALDAANGRSNKELTLRCASVLDLAPHLGVIEAYVAGYAKTNRWHTGSPKKNADLKLEYGFLTFKSLVVRDGVFSLGEVTIDGHSVMIKGVKAKGTAAVQPRSTAELSYHHYGEASPCSPPSKTSTPPVLPADYAAAPPPPPPGHFLHHHVGPPLVGPGPPPRRQMPPSSPPQNFVAAGPAPADYLGAPQSPPYWDARDQQYAPYGRNYVPVHPWQHQQQYWDEYHWHVPHYAGWPGYYPQHYYAQQQAFPPLPLAPPRRHPPSSPPQHPFFAPPPPAGVGGGDADDGPSPKSDLHRMNSSATDQSSNSDGAETAMTPEPPFYPSCVAQFVDVPPVLDAPKKHTMNYAAAVADFHKVSATS